MRRVSGVIMPLEPKSLSLSFTNIVDVGDTSTQLSDSLAKISQHNDNHSSEPNQKCLNCFYNDGCCVNKQNMK